MQRDPAIEKALADHHGKPATSASAAPSDNMPAKPQPAQGVYILTSSGGKLRANFVPVTTGVTGATDIEVVSGLKPGDEIVTGRYQILRALKSGTLVKRDNSTPLASNTSTSS